MDRRSFLRASVVGAASASAAALVEGEAEAQAPAREHYELQIYHTRIGKQGGMVDAYLRDAYLPALKRAGAGPVGVFGVMVGPDAPSTYVLITYPSAADVLGVRERVESDNAYRTAAAGFHDVPATDPAFVRLESGLFRAFAGMAKVEQPAKKGRMFELRTYESHSLTAHRKKVEMFNTAEIGIFRKTGLQPVFFGEGLIGSNLPKLTYMLTFENLAAREKNWGTFVSSPEWRELSGKPEYSDAAILTNITSIFLYPTGYSEI